MRYHVIALSLALMGVTLLASPARAQGHRGAVFNGVGRPATRPLPGRMVGGHFVRMRHGRPAAYYGYGPNYYPYYEPGYYPSDDAYDETAETPPVPFRAQTSAPTPSANPPKSTEFLVMELRGDRWVRLTSYGPMDIAGESSEPQPARTGSPAQAEGHGTSVHAQAPSQLPPAVLVFSDGHQEEAAKYTIVGMTIWIKTDYWRTGSWVRKIPISDLNLDATLHLNQERGAKFNLPSRPSEVIVR